MPISFAFREMTDAEFKREQVAFDEQGAEFGNPPEKQERFGFVATDTAKFVGCSSGLLHRNNDEYSKYFYLSDLLVENVYRKQAIGKQLLALLEDKVRELGCEYVWTWTAGYEAPEFYLKQGYSVFATFENFYPSGHARVGFIKSLKPRA